MDERIEADASASRLEVEVPLAPAHGSGRVTVDEAAATVTVPLVAGSGTVTTAPKAVGRVEDFTNPRLMATISVWHEFRPESRTLTLCGPDLISPDSTRIDTFPLGSDRIARHYTWSAWPAPAGERSAWYHSEEVAPGLAEQLRDTARAAQRAIAKAAEAKGLNVALRTPLPPLTPAQLADLRLVYHRGVFKKAYRPGEPLDEGDEVISVESVFGGTVKFNYAEAFANVIGSTDDPKINGLSWIALWSDEFGTPPQCTSLGFPSNFPCTPVGFTSPLGGHVITGTKAKEVLWGVDKVYIMPICSAHNNDDNNYMKALENRDGIWLKNYHQK